MSTVRSFFRSFNGGVVTPEFWGQIADSKFQTGLATCRNFIVLPHGPAQNRAGTQYVRATKTGAAVRLIPFEYSNEQTLVLEFGAGYIRFHTMGATVLSGSSPYEVATTYAQGDLPDIHFVQSADVLTLVHPSHPPRELRRLGATSWQMVDIQLGTPLTPPAAGQVSLSAQQAPSPDAVRPYWYKITRGNTEGQESSAFYAGEVSNNLDQTGAFNFLDFTATGLHHIYRCDTGADGIYGYVGSTQGARFHDRNVIPDLSRAPPTYDIPFTGAGNDPGAVTYFEQRRVFAGTTNKPQNLWATRSGTESALGASLPPRDDDALSFRIGARQVSRILHAVPLTSLVLLTGSTEFRVTATSDTGTLSPTSPPSVLPQSYVGANNVQPLVVNNTILFAAARGGHMREMAFNEQAGGYLTGDMSLRAPHLFDALTIKALAFAKAPVPIVWAVSSNGDLLGLTYVPEQQIGAWHHHDTGGTDEFLDVCTVPEGNEDAVYLAVRRTVDGTQRVYVERMASRAFEDIADVVFLDCSLTYRGAPATTISGLAHLEGRTVGILADGAELPQQVVTGGQVVLDNPASVVTIGLPIEADIKTLPMVLESVPAFGQGRAKNLNKAIVRVYRSRSILAGPRFDDLKAHKPRRNEPMGSPPDEITDELEIVLSPSWQSGGQVCIRQASPLPLTVVALALEASVAG